ncbi:MAG: class I SAM-dependent methyltransferase [Acidimicrobiia bacterium]|nr:class I SAM-dependent methyltransferase [Acidimicrobiia bacterium]
MIERPGREQSQIFGEDAALYERFRPGYPRELMEAVVAETGPGPVLEIGAGTGKATRALSALGKQVHALEPDGRMAALLQLNCGPALSRVDHVTLEDANLPDAAFDLAVAAQTWHWIDPEIGYDRVADALIPHGRLALLWHHPQPKQGLLGEAVAQLYARLAPDLPSIWPGTKASDFDPALEPFAATKRFRSWTKREHLWHRRLDAPSLVGWLCSGSEHRLLPIDQRTELMTAMAALVQELGGEVVVNMITVAHTAYRV